MENRPKHIKRLAVDADIVAHRVACVHNDPSDTLEEMYGILDECLANIALNSGVTEMTLYISDKTNFRYGVAVTTPYKGSRSGKPRPQYLNQAKQYLKDKYKAYVHTNMEADDCIATDMTINENVAHCGIDKDIRQIEGWHYNFVKGIWEYTSKEESPVMIYRQVLTGDSSDSVPGLSGVGPKKALEKITNPETARQDALAFYLEHKPKDKKYPEDDIGEITTYFKEQEELIIMVTDLDLSSAEPVTIELLGKPVEEDDAGDDDWNSDNLD